MKKWLFILSVLLVISGCESITTVGGNDAKSFREIKLSENEKVIFSLLADQIFYFDYIDKSKKFRQIEVGVDYFYYGKLAESSGGLIVSANDPETEWEDERARFLFTLQADELDEEMNLKGEMSVIFDSGTTNSSEYSYPRSNKQRGFRTAGYMLDEIDELSYGEKIYIGFYAENVESDSMRSFDPVVAVEPNDQFEHVYLYYVIIHEAPFSE
jgi:hypothetical protein